MSRSSTSSSEPLATAQSSASRRARVPRAALLTLVLLLAVEVGVARQEWVWDHVLASPSGIISALENQVISGASPQVVVMGSSRVRDGVAPRQMERELGLPKGATLNLAVTNGSTFDALTIYRRNRDVLGKAKVLVVGIEDRTFNAGWAPHDRDRRYMTLDERLGAYDAEHTLSLLAGWVWRTYDARGPFQAAIKSVIKGRKASLPIAEDGRVKWRDDEVEVGPAELPDPKAYERFYRRWEPTDGRKRFLEELTALAAEDGVKVLVIKLPWRRQHLDLIREHHPEKFAEYRRRAQSIHGAEVVLWDDPASVGLRDDQFYDYGHPTTRGAVVVTTAVAGELKARFPDAFRD
jgi:hypothetical protein